MKPYGQYAGVQQYGSSYSWNPVAVLAEKAAELVGQAAGTYAPAALTTARSATATALPVVRAATTVAARTAGTALDRASTYAAQKKVEAQHALWCRLHPVACFMEQHPWVKPTLIGIGVIWVGSVIYQIAVAPRRLKRSAEYASRAADSGLFGPEGMVAMQAARSATARRTNSRRRRRRAR